MNRLWSLAAAVAAILLGGAAAAGQARMDMPDKITVTERNEGQTIAVRVGQPVVVSLPENATTGYRWAVDRVDPETVEIREGESQYGSGAVGTGGRAQWIFVPKAQGTVSIALKRWRHWEGDASIVERFRIQLQVVQ